MKRLYCVLGIAVLTCVTLPMKAVSQGGRVPIGFTQIFNGRDTDGWHWSRTNHHGTNAEAMARDGVLILNPRPFGQGGILLTDKSYKDFELYLEALPDPNYNSGVFLRSSEGGSAYQLELVRPGNTGALLGEGQRITKVDYIGPRTDVNAVWKDGEWNSMRVLMVGEAPHMTLWINDVKLWEAQLAQNDQIAGMYGGKIGLQLHWTAPYSPLTGARGGPGGLPQAQRFRNIAIRELTR